ncbi:MaoC family dehydratase [Nocardia asteroides]|uniref:MaoC family dehydratase n=1 Tax=Nocardia asteroides TaxID=1824 RepID=UPI0034228188
MRTFENIGELAVAVGTQLGSSGWHTVTQDEIDAFAAATGDHQWIHVDPLRAAQGPFGTTVAHGYLTLSLVPYLTSQVYRVDGVRIAVNYGADKLRFPAPVAVESRVRAAVELLSVVQATNGYRVTTRVSVEREGSEKPGCVVDLVALMVP